MLSLIWDVLYGAAFYISEDIKTMRASAYPAPRAEPMTASVAMVNHVTTLISPRILYRQMCFYIKRCIRIAPSVAQI